MRETKTGGSARGAHYLVRSMVLGGAVVTRLTADGEKEYTYVPAGGLVEARQVEQGGAGQPAVSFTHLDPTGTSEPDAAYDPLGNRVVPQNPPTTQSPPFTAAPMYGPAWFGSGSSFSNANNYATGCLLDGRPTDCNRLMNTLQNRGAQSNGRQVSAPAGPTPGGGTWVPILGQACVGPGEPGGYCENYIAGYDWQGMMGENGFANEPDFGTRPNDVGRLTQESCDQTIARIFGSTGSVATTKNEPPNVRNGGRDYSHHLNQLGTAHMYGDEIASTRDAPLFAPPGGTPTAISGEYPEKDTNRFGSGRSYGVQGYSNHFHFNYARGIPHLGVNYAIGIRFFHVGGTIGGNAGGQTLRPTPGNLNSAGSSQLGLIAGLGGEGGPAWLNDKRLYNHTHIQFYVGKELTDPRKIFCAFPK